MQYLLTMEHYDELFDFIEMNSSKNKDEVARIALVLLSLALFIMMQ